MSILDTLITDRTQADVNRIKQIMAKGLPRMTADEYQYFIRGSLETLNDSVPDALVDADGLTIQCRDGVLPKGSYNYTDLNRVMDAVEYLTGVIRSAGYEIDDPVPITKTRDARRTVKVNYVLKNRIKNPTLENDGAEWRWWKTADSRITQSIQGGDFEYMQSEILTSVATNFTLARTEADYTGNDKGHVFYVGCQYMKNNSKSLSVLIGRSLNGTTEVNGYIEMPDVQNSIESFGSLYTMTSSYAYMRFGITVTSASSAGDVFYFRRPFVYDLTAVFGAGNEPSLEWCEENIGYDAGSVTGFYEEDIEETETTNRYKVQDIPTPSEMEIYLANVQRVIDRLPLVNVRYDTIPTLPTDMDGLLPAEANNIEKPLLLIMDTIERILTERLAFYSGELYGGEI